MNNIPSVNKAVFKSMKHFYPKALKDLSLVDNVLIYKDKTLLLGDYDLNSFYNYNSGYIENMSSEEIFKIVEVHVFFVLKIMPATKASHNTILLRPINLETSEQNNDKVTDIISMDEFILLANQEDEYTPFEKDKIEILFHECVKSALYYQESLIPEVKDILFEIENLIIRNKRNREFIKMLFIDLQEENNKRKKTAELNVQRRLLLQKASGGNGFMSSAIIISVALNIGILIALIILAK